MDSVGAGELPDAPAYGDQGINTLGNIAKQVPLALPTLRSLGLDRVAALGPLPVPPGSEGGRRGVGVVSDTTPARGRLGGFGRMAEASPGKDSVSGHWVLLGLVLDRPFGFALRDVPTGAIVFYGRVADPSIFMAPMMHEFRWDPLDHARVGAGNGIGHLLECGAQVTGGYFSDPGFKDVPEPWNLAFPIAEVEPDGSAVHSCTPCRIGGWSGLGMVWCIWRTPTVTICSGWRNTGADYLASFRA